MRSGESREVASVGSHSLLPSVCMYIHGLGEGTNQRTIDSSIDEWMGWDGMDLHGGGTMPTTARICRHLRCRENILLHSDGPWVGVRTCCAVLAVSCASWGEESGKSMGT